MPNLRKKVVLTIKQKLTLIEKYEKGESTSKLAKEYGVGTQTVRDIIKKKRKLEEFTRNCASNAGPSNRKTMKMSTYENLDSAMLKWFKEKLSEGIPINGPMCTHQAKFFHDALGLKGNFNASSGWLARFKQRHGIRDFTLREEHLSGDENIEGLENDLCDRDFQITGGADIISNLIKPEEQENEVESGETKIANRISHNTALNSVDTLLEYMDQWEFEYNDIIALRKIRCDIKKLLKDSCK